MQLQFRIFRLQYSTERICAAIGDISTIQRGLYCKLGAKYSAYLPVCTLWTMVPVIYNAFTAPNIQASIFNWTYLRWYWKYLDNSMIVILLSWCQIQRTFSGFRYVYCGPGHLQCNYSYVYSGFNIQVNQYTLLLEISRHFDALYNANLEPNIEHILQVALCELWSRDIQCNNSSAYSGFNIQVQVSALILEIYRQFNVRYTANMVPNTAHILQLTLSELWSRTYTM
jgi:hypothetical protein